jgi:TetR/AcrR family fatty acid metabolism transcriptional regulator
MQVFADKGFETTTIEEVARAAGVGKGTVYQYFANKAELIEGCLGSLIGEHMQLFEPVDHDSWTAVETLRHATSAMVAALARSGKHYRFFIEYMLYASRNPSVNEIMAQMLDQFRRLFTALFERGKAEGVFRAELDAAGAAAAYAAWFDGAIFHWMTAPDGPTLAQMADQYLELMLRGMLADPAGGWR